MENLHSIILFQEHIFALEMQQLLHDFMWDFISVSRAEATCFLTGLNNKVMEVEITIYWFFTHNSNSTEVSFDALLEVLANKLQQIYDTMYGQLWQIVIIANPKSHQIVQQTFVKWSLPHI